jgi:hypothetical protein
MRRGGEAALTCCCEAAAPRVRGGFARAFLDDLGGVPARAESGAGSARCDRGLRGADFGLLCFFTPVAPSPDRETNS